MLSEFIAFRALSVDLIANLKWFCFTQKQMDINAAIQALIESHTALQMEVIYLPLFTLAHSIYKLNKYFFRGQNVTLSQGLYLQEIKSNETIFKDKENNFNKQKYMHKIFKENI